MPPMPLNPIKSHSGKGIHTPRHFQLHHRGEQRSAWSAPDPRLVSQWPRDHWGITDDLMTWPDLRPNMSQVSQVWEISHHLFHLYPSIIPFSHFRHQSTELTGSSACFLMSSLGFLTSTSSCCSRTRCPSTVTFRSAIHPPMAIPTPPAMIRREMLTIQWEIIVK